MTGAYLYRVRRRTRDGAAWHSARYYTRRPDAERRAARWRAAGFEVAVDRSSTRLAWRPTPEVPQ